MENTTNEMSFDALQELFNVETQTEVTEIEDTEQFIPSTEEEDKEENEQEVTEEVIISDTDTDSYKIAQFLISTGELEDVVLELEDGTEKKLSEFKDIDNETLTEVIKTFKQEKKETESKDFIKVKGLTETQQKLIEIVQQGNYQDLKEIFENPENLREPWEGHDPTNDVQNEQVVRAYLQYIKKLDAQQIDMLVDLSKKNLTLDTEAQKYVALQREAFKKNLEEKSKKLEEDKKAELENQKKYTKELTDKLKSKDLKPELVLSMVKTATQDNRTALKDLFEETMKDIDKASDLVLFLTNKEVYDSGVKARTKLEEQVDYAKKIKIVRDSKKTNTTEQTDDKNTEDVLKDIFSFQ